MSLIVILSAGVIILNACNENEAIALPVDIADRLLEEMDIPGGILVTDENVEDTGQLAAVLMGDKFNPDMFDGYAFYPPAISVNASEFGILKVKDISDAEKAKTFAQRRIDSMLISFEDYLPDQYDIAKNGEIRADGRYVYYAMTDNNERVFDIIEEMLKDK